jgi:L-amino acid N-acyltransferase YncA
MALVKAATAAGIWTIQTGIFPENEASIALRRACGFRVVGKRERLGRLKGAWRASRSSSAGLREPRVEHVSEPEAKASDRRIPAW